MKALTKKKPSVGKDADNTTAKLRKGSVKLLMEISGKIFIENQVGHRKILVRGPSNRVAVDYLLLQAHHAELIKLSPEDLAENLYVRIKKYQAEVE